MKFKILLVLLLLLAMTAGAFLWWAFSPLLFNEEVQDELDPELRARLEAQRQVDNRRVSNDEDVETSDPVTEVDDSGVMTRGPFEVTGTPNHPAKGQVEIIRSPEETLLHYMNYEGTNGPDLFVYLAKDLEANEYIDLGEQKGNRGNIIYGVPLDVDLSEYKYILTWCKALGVLFDYAEIK
ncbi:MAG: DM13 domain-containing protein [Candidatus Paceibacterota bacterium]